MSRAWGSTGLGPPELDLEVHLPGWESRGWESRVWVSTGLGPPDLNLDPHSPGWESRGWESEVESGGLQASGHQIWT